MKQTNLHLLLKGIEVAKEMQMAIVRVGVSLIEKKDIKQADYFRYCVLENSYLKDIGIFQFPLALRKLALFIMQAYKVSDFNFQTGLVSVPQNQTSSIRDQC